MTPQSTSPIGTGRYTCGICFISYGTYAFADACCSGTVERTKTAAPRSTQVGGSHYTRHAIQPWDALEEWMSADQFTGFLLGSAQAYLARFNADAPGKGGIEDVKKARHYLDKLIEVMGATGEVK